MKLQILSIHVKEPIKHRNKDGSWKTLKPNTFTFLNLGKLNHFGESCLVGLNSQKISDTSKVKRDISNLENMNVDEKITWFKNNYPDVDFTYISEKLLDNSTNGSATISGSFYLKWDK